MADHKAALHIAAHAVPCTDGERWNDGCVLNLAAAYLELRELAKASLDVRLDGFESDADAALRAVIEQGEK